jgi:flagellar biosynthetic protein FliP
MLFFDPSFQLINEPLLQFHLPQSAGVDDWTPAVRLLILLTLMTLAPLMLLMMSGFTRITIVLSFLRQAIGSPNLPPTQVLIGLALFLTYFAMAPTLHDVYQNSIDPYLERQLNTQEALEKAQAPIRAFMIKQTRKADLKLFLGLSHSPLPENPSLTPFSVLVPSFVISELKSAFQIGFLIYLPFIAVDLVVSSILMSMGMMMLPPVVVSLPLKLIVFVLVDGWSLLVQSLLGSFVRIEAL